MTNVDYNTKKMLVIRSRWKNLHTLRAYIGEDIIHEYSGPDPLKVAWQFETDNPVFRNAKVINMGEVENGFN
jgi:hypothetical protein